MKSPYAPNIVPRMIVSPFIDIHTHQPPPFDQQQEQAKMLSIYNLEPEEYGQLEGQAKQPEPFNKNGTGAVHLSAGIHPYHILTEWEINKSLQQLDMLCTQQHIQFVGECGLDRLKGSDLQLQAKTFIKQIDLAEQYHKPLIIHCVRAFDVLIRIEKQHRIKVPAIIHGFHKSPEMALQLYDHGFMLSFGQAILRTESKPSKALVELWNRDLPFFLESDGSGLDIRVIYEAASNLLKISTDTLKDAIFASWKNLI